VSKIDAGALTLNQAVAGFTSSAEFVNQYGSLNNTEFVKLLYKNVLGRSPDPGGLANWLGALDAGMSRSDVVLGFSESAEDISKTRAGVEAGLWLRDDRAAQIARLYDATLNRLPDAAGLEKWTATLKSGKSLLEISADFVGSPEFQQTYGALDNTAFVTMLYNNVLDRSPDVEGLANWVNAVNSYMMRSEAVVGFSESEEHQSLRAAYIDNGIKLHKPPSSSAMGIPSMALDAGAASPSFADRVAQLGLLDETTFSASSSRTTASLTDPFDRSGILASAA
jgi:hypothetical protein